MPLLPSAHAQQGGWLSGRGTASLSPGCVASPGPRFGSASPRPNCSACAGWCCEGQNKRPRAYVCGGWSLPLAWGSRDCAAGHPFLLRLRGHRIKHTGQTSSGRADAQGARLRSGERERKRRAHASTKVHVDNCKRRSCGGAITGRPTSPRPLPRQSRGRPLQTRCSPLGGLSPPLPPPLPLPRRSRPPRRRRLPAPPLPLPRP